MQRSAPLYLTFLGQEEKTSALLVCYSYVLSHSSVLVEQEIFLLLSLCNQLPGDETLAVLALSVSCLDLRNYFKEVFSYNRGVDTGVAYAPMSPASGTLRLEDYSRKEFSLWKTVVPRVRNGDLPSPTYLVVNEKFFLCCTAQFYRGLQMCLGQRGWQRASLPENP